MRFDGGDPKDPIGDPPEDKPAPQGDPEKEGEEGEDEKE